MFPIIKKHHQSQVKMTTELVVHHSKLTYLQWDNMFIFNDMLPIVYPCSHEMQITLHAILTPRLS